MSSLSICRAAHWYTRCVLSPGQAPHRVQDHSAVAMPLPLPKSIARLWHPVLNDSNCRLPLRPTPIEGGELESFLVSANQLPQASSACWACPACWLQVCLASGLHSWKDQTASQSYTWWDLWELARRASPIDCVRQIVRQSRTSGRSTPDTTQRTSACSVLTQAHLHHSKKQRLLSSSAQRTAGTRSRHAQPGRRAMPFSSEIQLCVLNKRDLVSAEGGRRALAGLSKVVPATQL